MGGYEGFGGMGGMGGNEAPVPIEAINDAI
jgi:hypothetical protein